MLRLPHSLDVLHRGHLESRHLLYLFCLMMLFWALFDGSVAYLVPVAITESGMSATLMGIILGTSSVAGALFDFLLCRFFTNTYYKRLFVWMFAVCLFVPFILYKADTFWMFLVAMVMWGIYYDFKGIGVFNFVGKGTDFDKHAESFSLIQIFLSLGYLIAPLCVGFLVAEELNWQPFALAWIFIALSIFFFVILLFLSRKIEVHTGQSTGLLDATPRDFSTEIHLWKGIGRALFPVLFFIFLITFVDAFFWTIGPLLASELVGTLGAFSGAFMAIYMFPALFTVFWVGKYSEKFGKKHGAIISFFLGACILTLFPLAGATAWILPLVLVASLGLSLSVPLIQGSFADYIAETEEYEKEIEGLEDFYTNLGFIFGPMLAGFLSDQLGNVETFAVLGLFAGTCAVVLTLFMPKSINLKERLAMIETRENNS
jgi:MFS family permease